ncbi:hypothetical protein ACQKE5_00675 [Paenisporosarcina sp. NPDC076898]
MIHVGKIEGDVGIIGGHVGEIEGDVGKNGVHVGNIANLAMSHR